MTEDVSRIDVHVHSKYTIAGNDWRLSAMGINTCHLEPIEVYNHAQALGMDYVAITDQDCIEGALKIAHLPNVIVGEEISSRFPDDDVQVHVVALDINESQHQMIQSIKDNLFELVSYLNKDNITHYVAHPFHRIQAPLTVDHLEKMVLLFKVFEVKNSGKQIYPENLMDQVFLRLNPDNISHLADKHGVEPIGNEPWIKSKVAGSDDHSGLFIASPHTEMPKARSKAQLLKYIQTGECKPIGVGGSYQTIAHSYISIAYQQFKKSKSKESFRSEMTWNVLSQLLEGEDSKQHAAMSTRTFLLASKYFSFFTKDNWKSEFFKMIHPFFKKQRNKKEAIFGHSQIISNANQDLFEFCRRITYHVIERALKTWNKKDYVLKNVSRLTMLQPLLPLLAPYALAVRREYQDRPLMRQLSKNYLGLFGIAHTNRVAVFSDLDAHQIGKSKPFQKYLNSEIKQGIPIHVFGLGDKQVVAEDEYNFESVTSKDLGGFDFIVPPFFEIIEQLYKSDYPIFYIHTFQSMGILGILLGKWMGVNVICRYPHLTICAWLFKCKHHEQKTIVKSVLKWIFSQASQVRVHTKKAEEHAISIGVPQDKIVFIHNATAEDV